MHLTIVGCGFVGLALARQLQGERSQLTLTLTTTREERFAELEPLADHVRICDASDAISQASLMRRRSRVVLPWT